MPRCEPNPQRKLKDDSIAKVIAESKSPRTRESLARDLEQLGVESDDRLIVNTSMRSLGWVNGGAITYIQALQDAVGDTSSIVMPTQSGDYSDPGCWRHPPIPAEWIAEVKRTMPAYDPAVTPTWCMGTVPELFRALPGVFRSNHPSGSFAAWGQDAKEIVSEHGVQRIGEESPVARLYDLDGRVLLVRVGYNRNTCFHFSEYRASTTRYVNELMPLVVEGNVEWTEVSEIEFMDDQSLIDLGNDFEANSVVVNGLVGSAKSRLFGIRDCVDFGVQWLDEPD
jgi:aminoglycoside 3-N-acetyltransferase